MSFPVDIDDFDDKSYTGGRNEPSSRSQRDTQTPDTSGDLENLLQGLRQNRPGRADASTVHLNQSSSSSYSSSSNTRDSDLISLQRIWIAERTAPEILPFDEALIDRIMGRLREQVCISLARFLESLLTCVDSIYRRDFHEYTGGQ
jgi:hypothetical protein